MELAPEEVHAGTAGRQGEAVSRLRPVWYKKTVLVPYEPDPRVPLCDGTHDHPSMPRAVAWTTIALTSRKDGVSEVIARVNFCADCAGRFGLVVGGAERYPAPTEVAP